MILFSEKLRSSPSGQSAERRSVCGVLFPMGSEGVSARNAHDGIRWNWLWRKSHRSPNNNPFPNSELALEARREFAAHPTSEFPRSGLSSRVDFEGDKGLRFEVVDGGNLSFGDVFNHACHPIFRLPVGTGRKPCSSRPIFYGCRGNRCKSA